MKVSVKVPATSANIGPGFDCLGLALPLYDEITIEEKQTQDSEVEIEIISTDENYDVLSIPRDKNNLAYRAAELLYTYLGKTISSLKITIKTSLPAARGLGSSASVVIGSLFAANELLNRPADNALLLSIAAEIEGHPDNAAPALLGGFCISSVEDDGSVAYSKLDWPQEWKFTVIIPDYELDTRIARSVLPENISLADAAYNIRKCAMLVDAVNRHDAELMKKCLKDKLHQPYREKLVSGFKELNEFLADKDDILGCVISGAGPSILIISQNDGFEKVSAGVKQIFESLKVHCSIKTFNIEKEGAKII